MYSFDKFRNSKWTLVIIKDEKVFYSSKARAIKPLVRLIKSNPGLKDVIIYDRYIGRAAAMLMTFVKPKKVYTPIISQFGIEVFEKYKIDYQAEETVKYLMGIASDDTCHWEKLTVGKTPKQFWEMLNK